MMHWGRTVSLEPGDRVRASDLPVVSCETQALVPSLVGSEGSFSLSHMLILWIEDGS